MKETEMSEDTIVAGQAQYRLIRELHRVVKEAGLDRDTSMHALAAVLVRYSPLDPPVPGEAIEVSFTQDHAQIRVVHEQH
jgi:hypothetical protein